jgi:hypothetical protein
MTFRNRLCMVTDIVGYSGHTVPERADAERRLHTVQQFALAQARAFLVRPLRREDRGDGQLLLLPPRLDPTVAIPALVAALRHGLYQVNADPGPFGRLRVRVSMAQGAISEHGPLGFRGDALIVACRLNDGAPLKDALAGEPAADLGFIVPDDLYRDVVRHDFGSLRSAGFSQVKVSVKEYDGTAWMYLPPAGPVPDLAGPRSSSLWQTAAAGALVAGLVAVTLPSSDPVPLPAYQPEAAAGDAPPAGVHPDALVAGADGHGYPYPYAHDPGAYPHGHGFPPHPLAPGEGFPAPWGGSPAADDAWLPDADDDGGQAADPGFDLFTEW